jgi:ketosteroid isomerase-like protein
MNRLLAGVLLMVLSIPVLVFAQTPAAGQSAAERAIRETDAALAKAVAAKNVDECMAFMDAEAALPGAEGTVYGAKDPKAVRPVWEKLFAIPGFNLKWTAEQVVVLKSGTLAFSSGSYDNGLGKGKFFAVWRKQADGKWKVLVDAAWDTPAKR